MGFTDEEREQIENRVLARITDDTPEYEKLGIFGDACAALALEKVANRETYLLGAWRWYEVKDLLESEAASYREDA